MRPLYITFSDDYTPDVHGDLDIHGNQLTVKFTYKWSDWAYEEMLEIDSNTSTVIVYTEVYDKVYVRRNKDEDNFRTDPYSRYIFHYLRTMSINQDTDSIYMTKVATYLGSLLYYLKEKGFNPPYIIYIDKHR